MTTNYDPIAEQYKRSKQQPWRADVEAFTLMRLIGDPVGKGVIDVVCGEGFYTRMIRQRGAAKVTGRDLSEKKIKLARGSEAEQHLGIDYIVGDGRNLGLAAEYDIAVAAYFLNYAYDRAELNTMCSGVARCLWAGLLVGFVGPPTNDFHRMCQTVWWRSGVKMPMNRALRYYVCRKALALLRASAYLFRAFGGCRPRRQLGVHRPPKAEIETCDVPIDRWWEHRLREEIENDIVARKPAHRAPC